MKFEKFYRRQAIHMLMFGFVRGLRAGLPSMSIKDCVIHFMNHHDIQEDDISVDSLCKEYSRMLPEYKLSFGSD